MEISTLPSGERAMEAIFFLFSKGNVLDLLLEWRSAGDYIAHPQLLTSPSQTQKSCSQLDLTQSSHRAQRQHFPACKRYRRDFERRSWTSLPLDVFHLRPEGRDEEVYMVCKGVAEDTIRKTRRKDELEDIFNRWGSPQPQQFPTAV